MAHAALSSPLGQAELARLDLLIAAVARSPDAEDSLLLEHLHSARTALLGAMPEEYEFSLVSAKHTAVELPDPALQQTVKDEVARLLDALSASRAHAATAPPHRQDWSKSSAGEADKSELYRFFHGTATTLGVFYPTHYIFASFPSFEKAKRAAEALQTAGYSDLVATSSSETFRFMKEIQAHGGVWGAVMGAISRFFGTEEVFADIDFTKAENGAGFLAIYCPREEAAERICDLVAPFEPLAMQLYLPDGIRSLVAGQSPGPQGNHPDRN